MKDEFKIRSDELFEQAVQNRLIVSLQEIEKKKEWNKTYKKIKEEQS